MKYIKTTLRQYCEAERAGTMAIPGHSDFKEWLGDREWPLSEMIARFGPTLTEKDGFTHASGDRVDDMDCSVCDRHSEPDQELIKMELDGVCLCLSCLEKMVEVLKSTKNEASPHSADAREKTGPCKA